jgi:hypothetical protein
MMLIVIALLQATPVQTDANAQPPASEQPAAAEVPETPEPKMKRVCRKVMDPRTPTLAARQTVCKYVPADEDTTARR